MPVMNGPDACKEIRGLGCDAFIAGVTGNVMEEDVVLFKKRGANGVLLKPFKLSELDQLWIECDVVGHEIAETKRLRFEDPMASSNRTYISSKSIA